MIQRVMVAFLMVMQGMLVAYELVARYDTWVRQVALTLTNVSAIVIFLFVNRYLRRTYGMILHWVGLAIICVSVWLDALGNFQHYYGKFWWWDHLTHGIGGLALTAGLGLVILSFWHSGRLHMSWRVANLFAFSVAQMIGAVYEVSEWIGDISFGTHRIGDHFDTPRDLFFNLLGGLVVLAVAAVWRWRNRAVRPHA